MATLVLREHDRLDGARVSLLADCGCKVSVFDAFALDPDAGLGGSCPDWEPDGERDENDAGGVSGSYGIALPTLSVSFSASGVRS